MVGSGAEEPVIDWKRLESGRPIWRFDPYRIGILTDAAMGTPPVDHFKKAMRMAFDDAYEQGLLLKPVELIVREVNGLPYGNFAEVREAWRQLVHDEGVLAVAGPWLSENGLALIDDVERDRVPSLSMAVVGAWSGPYRFCWQNGDGPQDAWLVADYMRRQGWKTVALMHEDNTIGHEYYDYFGRHARRMGLRLVSDQLVPARAGKLLNEMYEIVLRAKPDCFAYFGYGTDGVRFLQVAREVLGNSIPLMTGGIFKGCTTPGYGYGGTPKDIEGWIGIDPFDERNPATKAFLDRYEARYGDRPRNVLCTQGYDWGACLSEAMSMMRPATPEALRDALEKVRCLPAVTGSLNTTISFAPYDHRAYKGDKWVSLSKCENGVVTKVD